MVFDPGIAPTEGPAPFIEWYDAQADAEAVEDINTDYGDSARTTPLLRAWFLNMIKEFPTDPDPQDEFERAAQYSIENGMIYINFSWSDTEAAYEATYRLAAKHGVGFFDVSSEDGKVWLPEPPGELRVAFKTS